MTRFDITQIVNQLGESIVLSSVVSTVDIRGDATEVHTEYVVSGVVQMMDGSEEEVTEGILDKEDIIVFFSDTTGNVEQIDTEDLFFISTTTVGKFRVHNVLKHDGHYEVQAKKI